MTIVDQTIVKPCYRCSGTGKIEPVMPIDPNSEAYSLWLQGHRPPTKKCKRCDSTGQLTAVNPAWLRTTREAAGLTRREFARQTGLSDTYIAMIENAHTNCTLHILAHYVALIKS